jgi:hypothetical protein
MEQNSKLSELTSKINDALKSYSEKDWNYSVITLEIIPLDSITGPYALWIDVLDCRSKIGSSDYKSLINEVAWGTRHSSELGILELISLRINKALLDSTTIENWNYHWPAIRMSKREDLSRQGITSALWYRVEEVSGEDFDNR